MSFVWACFLAPFRHPARHRGERGRQPPLPRGRLFSLMHEYAHVLLQTGGLCDTTTDMRAANPDRDLEARCNATAGSLLVPSHALLARGEVITRKEIFSTWDYETLKPAAGAFGLSAEVILHRLTT